MNWENDGDEIKNFKGSVVRNPITYFNKSISWSKISAGNIAFRSYPNGFIYDVAGTSLFPFDNTNYNHYIGVVNSNSIRHILKVISPTLNFEVGQIATLPITTQSSEQINNLVEDCINKSKSDWDAHETSWDFKENELVRIFNDNGWGTLDIVVSEYKAHWTRQFNQLHANEEELNRQFIEIYGLQDELTADVPLDEITILQQGEISIVNNNIVWHDDVIAKQLISYAIGCWLGRYRLDKPGLHIAHPAPTPEEICTYSYNGNDLEIDDDGIMPILSADSSFADNACHRVRDFLRIAFGDEDLISNINWIESAIGKSLEAYFAKDFWKDHKKIYQNRPIYWLFSSKKGAFQCLAYMHRMDAYTAERVRSKYLLPHMEWLSNQIADLVAAQGTLTTAQSRMLDRLRKELDECREYHDRLHVVADHQIAFDLDDGVVVNYAKFGDILAKIK